MRIKAEQQDESESTPEQVAAGREEIEQRIRELVLEAVSSLRVHAIFIYSADTVLI